MSCKTRTPARPAGESKRNSARSREKSLLAICPAKVLPHESALRCVSQCSRRAKYISAPAKASLNSAATGQHHSFYAIAIRAALKMLRKHGILLVGLVFAVSAVVAWQSALKAYARSLGMIKT